MPAVAALADATPKLPRAMATAAAARNRVTGKVSDIWS
jgi:hypothetical protein